LFYVFGLVKLKPILLQLYKWVKKILALPFMPVKNVYNFFFDEICEGDMEKNEISKYKKVAVILFLSELLNSLKNFSIIRG